MSKSDTSMIYAILFIIAANQSLAAGHRIPGAILVAIGAVFVGTSIMLDRKGE